MTTTETTTAARVRPRRRSRYDRPRRLVSWTGLLLGLLLGVAGGFIITRTLAPAEEINTTPRQLRPEDKAAYMVAIMLNYTYDGNLIRTVNQLLQLDLPGDPIAAVAETACALASSGYASSASGERGIRSMMAFYQAQGQRGCADELLPPVAAPTRTQVVVASTPTLPPPPTKTPTPPGAEAPDLSLTLRVVPTVQPQRRFEAIRVEPFCDVEFPGVIEVRVRQRNAAPIPGQRVRVRWEGGESIFATGLKEERGLDYADFTMEPDRSYTVDLPGESNPTNPLSAVPCTDPSNNQPSLRSYYVVFVPSAQ